MSAALHRSIMILVLASQACLLSGCSDDFGASCTLPTRVREQCQLAAGGGQGMESRANCVMEENLDCSSKTCAVYNNSSPFCTDSCTTDGDCPDGARCLPFFIFEDSGLYCVPEAQVPPEESQQG